MSMGSCPNQILCTLQRPEFNLNVFSMQNRSDAQKALNKNGMQLNGVLIVGVKSLDPIQRQALNVWRLVCFEEALGSSLCAI